jgi:hypothetical protein
MCESGVSHNPLSPYSTWYPRSKNLPILHPLFLRDLLNSLKKRDSGPGWSCAHKPEFPEIVDICGYSMIFFGIFFKITEPGHYRLKIAGPDPGSSGLFVRIIYMY